MLNKCINLLYMYMPEIIYRYIFYKKLLMRQTRVYALSFSTS